MTEIACSSNSLMFDGIFAGMEGKLRITNDKKWVSVIDVISVVGGQSNPRKTWADIKNEENLCVTFCNTKTFTGKGNSNVDCVNAEGLVHLINRIPGKNADAFRLHEAKILVRYLGGDLSLVDEIKAIDQLHRQSPDNVAQIFRNDETVQQNLHFFTEDQRNNSNRLVLYFSDKLDTVYGILFYRGNVLMMKIGCVPLRLFEGRHGDHDSGKSGLIKKTDEICYSFIFQMKDPFRVESEFKATKFYTDNSTEITNEKDPNRKVTEVFLLNETLTSEMIKEEIMKVAGDRILDPPTYATVVHTDLEIEREHTKQKELDLELKKLSIDERKLSIDERKLSIDEKKLSIDEKRLEFEILKFNANLMENKIVHALGDDLVEELEIVDEEVIDERDEEIVTIPPTIPTSPTVTNDDSQEMNVLEQNRQQQDFFKFLDKTLTYKENHIAGYVNIVDNYFGKGNRATQHFSHNKVEFRNKIIRYLEIKGLNCPYDKHNFKKTSLRGFYHCSFTPIERVCDPNETVVMKRKVLVSVIERIFEISHQRKRKYFFPTCEVVQQVYNCIYESGLDTFEHRNVSFIPLKITNYPSQSSNSFGFTSLFVNDIIKVINELGFPKCVKPHGYYITSSVKELNISK